VDVVFVAVLDFAGGHELVHVLGVHDLLVALELTVVIFIMIVAVLVEAWLVFIVVGSLEAVVHAVVVPPPTVVKLAVRIIIRQVILVVVDFVACLSVAATLVAFVCAVLFVLLESQVVKKTERSEC
jgi:hypothetical protein